MAQILMILLGSFLTSIVGTYFIVDDPSSCLQSSNCDENRDCSKHIYNKQCLTTIITPFSYDPSLVSCCLKCCIDHFLVSFSLHGDKIQTKSSFKIVSHHWKHIHYGIQKANSISSLVIPDGDLPPMGNISVFQVTTISTIDKSKWKKILGRRVLLISHVNRCVDLDSAQSTMQTMAHFNNPRVSIWFTTQIPCNWYPSLSTKNLEQIDTKPVESKGLRKKGMPAIERKIRLIPVGVRDDILLTSLTGSQRSSPTSIPKILTTDSSARRILLYCGCARHFSDEGNRLVQALAARGLCGSELRSSSSTSSPPTLATEYEMILKAKFVLSPSFLTEKQSPPPSTTAPDTSSTTESPIQSHCEWEALAAGAIPVVQRPKHPSFQTLLKDLPILFIDDWSAAPLSSATQLEENYHILQRQFRTSNQYSLSKLYFPYWLDQYSNFLLSGKPPARFFREVDTGLQRNTPKTCVSSSRSSPSRQLQVQVQVEHANPNRHYIRSHRQREESNNFMEKSKLLRLNQNLPMFNISRNEQDFQLKQQLLELQILSKTRNTIGNRNKEDQRLAVLKNLRTSPRKRTQTVEGDRRDGQQWLTGREGTKEREVKVLEASTSLKRAVRKYPSSRGHSDGEPSYTVLADQTLGDTPTTGVTTGGSGVVVGTSPGAGNPLSGGSASSEDVQVTGRDRRLLQRSVSVHIGNVTGGHQIGSLSSTARSLGALGPAAALVELVIPRCCEDGIEIKWLTALLAAEPKVTVSIYYKCPSCLPKSSSLAWAEEISKDPVLRKKTTRGIRVLDDTELMSFGSNRVKQFTNFDKVYNAKEVSAYLQHILSRYDNLALHTVFLHTTPHAHIYFELFFRTIRWITTCPNSPVNFLHLNVKYKSGLWGECCGRQGACRKSTWSWLDMANDGAVATYSSAQFVVSNQMIRKKSKGFYLKMLQAINGSHDLPGCPVNSENGKVWGGHQLTGQYERMWHVIYGYPKMQPMRPQDTTIPQYLRIDCSYYQCEGAV